MISVITCTFNRSLQMKRGLLSLLRGSLKPDQLIIVDDGSTDNTKQVAEEIMLDPASKGVVVEYLYLNHPEHRISCIAHNVGIKQARGDILVFTEPENLHLHDNLKKLVGHLEEDKTTAVATQIWTIQEKIYHKLNEDNFLRPETLLTHQYAQLTDNTNLQNMKAPDSDWAITGSNNCVTGCFYALKKEWMMDIGGYDEEFTGHGWDDFDIFERLNVYGKGPKYHNNITVFHQWHKKEYPYNIYDHAEANGKRSAERTKRGEYKANVGKNWGQP